MEGLPAPPPTAFTTMSIRPKPVDRLGDHALGVGFDRRVADDGDALRPRAPDPADRGVQHS